MSVAEQREAPGAPGPSEVEANQQGLHEEFERLAAALTGRAEVGHRPGPTAATALDRVAEAFGLTPFERGLLALSAGAELHTELAQAVASSAGAVCWSLAQGLLPQPHWSAISPGGTLRRWQLVQVGAGPLPDAPVRVPERMLHYLLGIDEPDSLLAPLVTGLRAAELLPAAHAELADRIVGSWADPSAPWLTVALHGDDRDGRLDVAWAACAALGLEPRLVRGHDLPVLPAERELLATVWTRDSLLSGLALVIDVDEGVPEAQLAGWLERVDGPVVVCSRESVGLPGLLHLEVDRPSAPEQRGLWGTVLAEHHTGPAWEHVADQLSSTHRLSAREIVECGRLSAGLTDPGEAGRAVRAQLRHVELSGLARPIRPRARWSDLVLPEDRIELLHALADQVRTRRIVHDDWGFAAVSARGLAVTALFAGESGTGKTMAAEVIAHELGLDLLHVDLSAVVSKYIGETEKNLRLVFDGADATGAILLFDEADALFGKRSEVRDSHDRYANIEVSYLLQRMESYRGLAILTTNARANLDHAFVRRLGFVVQFPFPDAERRARIWAGAFPEQTPTEGLDPQVLSKPAISGGTIRNIAVAAAFRAAAAGGAVGMREVTWAARAELAKAERTMSPADLAGWCG